MFNKIVNICGYDKVNVYHYYDQQCKFREGHYPQPIDSPENTTFIIQVNDKVIAVEDYQQKYGDLPRAPYVFQI